MSAECHCDEASHGHRRVAVTGGPGAGKTAVLEVLRRHLCRHVQILPESASILFVGGFPRRPTDAARRSAQRAIWHVQVELERLAHEDTDASVAICDRGTVDGLAYWPGRPEEYWRELGTTIEAEYARYAAVVHLRTPPPAHYNHANPARIESAREAALIDERIYEAWAGHPRRYLVESTLSFVDKVATAVALVRAEVPPCCQGARQGVMLE